jgi:hypothetical protein
MISDYPRPVDRAGQTRAELSLGTQDVQSFDERQTFRIRIIFLVRKEKL